MNRIAADKPTQTFAPSRERQQQTTTAPSHPDPWREAIESALRSLTSTKIRTLAVHHPDMLEAATTPERAQMIDRLAQGDQSFDSQTAIANIIASEESADLVALLGSQGHGGTIEEIALARVTDPKLRAKIDQTLPTPATDPAKFPLFAHYKSLERTIAKLDFGVLPTPVQALGGLETSLGTQAHLYVKRDDLSSPVYGGNKVRKFEFTLAEVLAKGQRKVITGGGTGSHMAVATAIYGQKFNLPTEVVLLNQPNSPEVQQSLLLDKYYGAQMAYTSNEVFFALTLAWAYVKSFAGSLFSGKPLPYLMLPGDSNANSCLGYANAGFELAAQVRAGTVPEPDYIYVAAGSCGTMAGLVAGLRLAGLKTKVVGVQVAEPMFDNEDQIADLANQTLDLLASKTFAHIPKSARITADDVVLQHDYYGAGYGSPTPEGEAAIAQVAQSDGLKLESTYTGKAMAAMIDFAKRPEAAGKNIMFMNTFNSVDLSKEAAQVKPSDLPASFQQFFE